MGDQPGPFDWGDYLALAQELVARAGHDAALRSAISRAHCAVLGRSADLPRKEGRTVSALRTQVDVWVALRDNSDPRRRAIARELRRLRDLRNAADYNAVFVGDLDELARDGVTAAAGVLDTLDEVRSGPREDASHGP